MHTINLMPFPIEIILQNNYCVKDKENFFKYIFLSKISNLYNIYLESNRYKKELGLIKKLDGEKTAHLYQFVAENFISYYYYSKPHIKKIKYVDQNNDNENNNYKDINNKTNLNITINTTLVGNNKSIVKNYTKIINNLTNNNRKSNKNIFQIIKDNNTKNEIKNAKKIISNIKYLTQIILNDSK